MKMAVQRKEETEEGKEEAGKNKKDVSNERNEARERSYIERGRAMDSKRGKEGDRERRKIEESKQ